VTPLTLAGALTASSALAQGPAPAALEGGPGPSC